MTELFRKRSEHFLPILSDLTRSNSEISRVLKHKNEAALITFQVAYKNPKKSPRLTTRSILATRAAANLSDRLLNILLNDANFAEDGITLLPRARQQVEGLW